MLQAVNRLELQMHAKATTFEFNKAFEASTPFCLSPFSRKSKSFFLIVVRWSAIQEPRASLLRKLQAPLV